MFKLSDNTIRIFFRIGFGIVYLWFGILKFFPGASPAEALAKDTIDVLFFGFIPRDVSIILLAIFEIIIGLGFFIGKKLKIIVALSLIHIACTFSPLFLFPDICFQKPFVFTIIGQYIVKNLVFVAALLFLRPAGKTQNQ